MPVLEPSKFLLFLGKNVIGTITRDPGRDDFPWLRGNFVAADEFESASHFFENELSFLRERRMEEFDEVWKEIGALGLKIQKVGTTEIHKVAIIHIEGDKVSWRPG
jgi:hypothetical protein